MKCVIALTLTFLLASAQMSTLDDITTFGFNGETKNVEGCWMASYGRGAGVPISTCPSGTVQDGLLCYPPCQEGFTGVGPVCWQNCPADFPDTGADCLKPPAYGRGAGYTNEQQCEESNEELGCSKYGLLWYPNCEANFHNVGCCICSPDCPSGMKDIGVSCQKESYGRGAGVPLTCSPNLEYDAGLCYPTCNDPYSGLGPVCWGPCPDTWYACGALCLEDQSECTQKVDNITEAVVKLVEALAEDDPIGALVGVEDVIEELDFPICAV